MPHAIFDYQDMITPMGASAMPSMDASEYYYTLGQGSRPRNPIPLPKFSQLGYPINYSTVSSTAPSTWGGTQNEYSQMLGQLGISGGYTKPSPIVGSSSGSSGGGYSSPSGGSGSVYNPSLGTGQGITEGGSGGCPAGYSSGSSNIGGAQTGGGYPVSPFILTDMPAYRQQMPFDGQIYSRQ